jgi:hypothetical protein
VEGVTQSLADRYLDRLLSYLVEEVGKTSHLQFYTHWVKVILVHHGPSLKSRSQSLMAVWRSLEKNMSRRRDELARV